MSRIDKALKIIDNKMQKIIDTLQSKLKDFDGIFGRRNVGDPEVHNEYIYDRENITTNHLDVNYYIQDFMRVKFVFEQPNIFGGFKGIEVIVTYGLYFTSPTVIDIDRLARYFDTSEFYYKISLFKFHCANNKSKFLFTDKEIIPEPTGDRQYCIYLKEQMHWNAFDGFASDDDGPIKIFMRNILTHKQNLYDTLRKYSEDYRKDDHLIDRIWISNKY